jgi:sterol desaturase/sphingolipid hydroxylase (fatty acid hydroxylase superfamily)
MDTFKQLFFSYCQGLLAGLFFNLGIISITYLLVWKKFRHRLRHRRIQVPGRVDREQINSELRNSFFTLLVSALFTSIIFYLNTKGYTKIYSKYSEHSPFYAIAGFFFLLLIDDTWFYWIHRLLHHPSIFRYVHAVHHKSIDVNPFSSLSFHWIEPFLLTVWIFPVVWFIPTFAPILGFVQVFGLLDNIKSHLGYELYPANWNKSWLRFLTSSTFHNMHHRKFKGNYGVHFRIWDKFLKTEFYDYEVEFDRIQDQKKLYSDS